MAAAKDGEGGQIFLVGAAHQRRGLTRKRDRFVESYLLDPTVKPGNPLAGLLQIAKAQFRNDQAALSYSLSRS
ncbi:hypothetical protein A6A05_19445 [Magnetospirillum moscoviense]|uniref:Uncharacterized protein n=1 Tax=Magnetospirillum moscoviense TaxID=1437059 RepID=A0A178MYL7_9PROT|nr:hypothetical protein A6A05_19445 [Magnetospirillum moscoviense]